MYERYGKRLLDIILSLAATIILAIPMGLVALWIKLDSPGPVFFKQRRVGKGKTHFNILKFRTMRGDTPHDVPTHLLKDADSYITGSGAFLRKTSLDELPQLYDIFIGNMTIVGPRPERLETIELYEKEMPEFGMRLQVKAGLTGYAQVYGKANTSPYDKLQMDLMYIGEQSVITDLKIIFATIKILFMPESTEGFAEEKDALGTDEVTDSMQ